VLRRLANFGKNVETNPLLLILFLGIKNKIMPVTYYLSNASKVLEHLLFSSSNNRLANSKSIKR